MGKLNVQQLEMCYRASEIVCWILLKQQCRNIQEVDGCYKYRTATGTVQYFQTLIHLKKSKFYSVRNNFLNKLQSLRTKRHCGVYLFFVDMARKKIFKISVAAIKKNSAFNSSYIDFEHCKDVASLSGNESISYIETGQPHLGNFENAGIKIIDLTI